MRRTLTALWLSFMLVSLVLTGCGAEPSEESADQLEQPKWGQQSGEKAQLEP
jgi:hypothetical protein